MTSTSRKRQRQRIRHAYACSALGCSAPTSLSDTPRGAHVPLSLSQTGSADAEIKRFTSAAR